MEPKVAREVAEEEFARFMREMDLREEDPLRDADDQQGYEENKRIFIESVMAGKLVVNEDGEPVFTTSEGRAITFHEPTGNDIMAMDKAKQTQKTKGLFNMLASQTGAPLLVFAKMRNRERKVCEAIFVLFMAAR